MRFLKDEVDKINKLIDNKLIKVKGINSFGNVFELSGYGLASRKNKFVLKHKFKEKFRESFFYDTHFCLNKTDLFDLNFILLEIYDENGNKIFENKDKDLIVSLAKRNGIKKSFKDLQNGTNILNYDPLSEKLKEMVGQPIIIFNGYAGKKNGVHEGVFFGFNRTNESGWIEIYYLSCEVAYKAEIHSWTALETISPSGEKVLLVDNNKYDCEDFYEERLEYLRQIEKEKTLIKEIKSKEKKKQKQEKSKVIDDDWWQEK